MKSWQQGSSPYAINLLLLLLLLPKRIGREVIHQLIAPIQSLSFLTWIKIGSTHTTPNAKNTKGKLQKLTKLYRFLLPFRPFDTDDEDWWGWAVLARNPVRTLGAFHAHDRRLQSYLPLPSPLHNLHTFTHSKETATHNNTGSLNKHNSKFPLQNNH